jgi:DNA replication ATP-dependent helicase Dna2
VPILELATFPTALSRSAPWMKNVINPFRPVVFADTDKIVLVERPQEQDAIDPLERNGSRGNGGNIVNDTEAHLARLLLQGLVDCGVAPSDIGVICPFNSQVCALFVACALHIVIRRLILCHVTRSLQIRALEDCEHVRRLKDSGLEINTIDKYQGRDKAVILVSFVRSNNKGKVGRLLEDKRRVNVAITRAKHKMILVGSFSTLRRGSPTLQVILDLIKQQGRVVSVPSQF